MSATLFNQTLRWAPNQPGDAPPAPFEKLVIVGGGTAGWMSALILADALTHRGCAIEVLESPTVPTIGVGEGSTPWLRGFFDGLGIEEAEWMPACHATYKCGITFDRWSTRPGYERYFHPFASMLDNLTMTQFVHNANCRQNGADVDAHPNRFFIAARLAELHKAPKPRASFPFEVWYGYHFDAVLLGQFLMRKALARGVTYRSCHVAGASLDASGAIASVATRDGETIAADFFVDCTGFASLLIGKALGTPWVSFADNLFNDAAVAMPTPIGATLPPETVATALDAGWAWKIPLTSRYGNGYVYSSSFIGADEAERELRAHLGLLDSDVEARHLKMRIGRVTQHWNRNCLAIGLAQGFIEPLEATALLFIQRTAQTFVEYLAAGALDARAREEFNARINDHFEGTRDYIVTHYKTNTRTDTEYWRANATNTALSEPLKQLFALWLNGQKLAPAIKQGAMGRGYPTCSWYCILAGVGLFPERGALRAPDASDARYDLDEIDDLLERSAQNFPDQREALAAIAPRRREKALQIYFW